MIAWTTCWTTSKQRRRSVGTLKLVAEPGKHDIVTSREFNAPRDLVFKAFTDPTLLPKWWGPTRMTTTIDQMEVRMGGIWRYVLRDLAGNESGFHGVYHEVLASKRLVFTFEWEGMPGHVLLETVTFAAHDGKTLVTDSSIFQSVADRDGMLRSGMEEGTNESYDRLDDLLANVSWALPESGER
jgi:uncharacterized protein YndB with AHSA1/START domain